MRKRIKDKIKYISINENVVVAYSDERSYYMPIAYWNYLYCHPNPIIKFANWSLEFTDFWEEIDRG